MSEEVDPVLLKEFDATITLLHEFFEWRHKLMTRFAISAGAFGIAYYTVGSNDDWSPGVSDDWKIALLLVGLVISIAVGLLDWRNSSIICRIKVHGSRVEERLGVDQKLGSRFFDLIDEGKKFPRYRVVLPVVYFGSAILCGALMISPP